MEDKLELFFFFNEITRLVIEQLTCKARTYFCLRSFKFMEMLMVAAVRSFDIDYNNSSVVHQFVINLIAYYAIFLDISSLTQFDF